MRITRLLSLLIATPLAAQTINVNQIRPSTTPGDVITTVAGSPNRTVWQAPTGGVGTVPVVPIANWVGPYTANLQLGVHTLPFAATIPSGCTGSTGLLFALNGGSAPTATGSIVVNWEDTTSSTIYCTYTWSASGTNAVVTGSGGTTTANHTFAFVFPGGTPDATAENFSFIVSGSTPGGSGGGSFTAGGDLGGTNTVQEVLGLLSNPLPSLSVGVLGWSGSAWQFETVGTGNVQAPSTLTNNAVVIGQGTNQAATIAVDTNPLHVFCATAGAPAFCALVSGMIPNNAADTSGTAAKATNLAGGALGSAPYQNAANTTLFIASPTTAAHQFFYGWAPSGSALAPAAFDLGMYLNTNLLATSPLTITPSALGWTISCATCTTSATGTAFSVLGGGALGTANLTQTTPSADANYLALLPKISGSNFIIEAPYATNAALGVAEADGTSITATLGVFSAVDPISGTTSGQVAIAGASQKITSSIALGTAANNIPQLNGSAQLALSTIPTIPLTQLANQSADTMVMKASAGSGPPTAVTAPTGGTNGCGGANNAWGYSTTTHAFVCNVVVRRLCQGTITLPTTSVASVTSDASPATASCPGLLTTDTIQWSVPDLTSTVGYMPAAGGTLTIYPYPTSGQVNIKRGNSTAATITPGSVIVNFAVDVSR